MDLSPKYNDLGLGRDMAWYACPSGLLCQRFVLLSFYAPNFKEVEEAYWFGPVRASVRGSHFAYGQERLEIGS